MDRFRAVHHWIFDLDNTLYPSSAGIDAQMDVRIRDFVADALKIDPVRAHEVQKRYYRDHGTTLRGLMTDHNIDPGAFLSYVHDLDYTCIAENAALAAAIDRLAGQKYIFTNGDRGHAGRVVARLGLADRFAAVFDIVDAGLMPKPAEETYRRFLGRYGIDPRQAVMFEDQPRNLVVPHRLGMTTVLVVPEDGDDVRYDWERHDGDEPYIDYKARDLAAFVGAIADRLVVTG